MASVSRTRLFRFATRWLLFFMARIEVTGAHNLQREGAYIICGNHLHLLDSMLIYSIIPAEKRIGGLAADKWRNHAITRWILESVEIVWIKRGEVDRAALNSIVRQLKRGNVVGIAPEGTRSKTGGLQRARDGVFWLARVSDAPIIPVAHWGIEQVGLFKRPQVRICIGEPIVSDPALSLSENTDRLMRIIAGMLPEQYRGVYADQRFDRLM